MGDSANGRGNRPVAGWYEAVGVDRSMVARIVSELGAGGVELSAVAPGADGGLPPGNGLVVFAEVTPEVRARIRRAGRKARVLALCTASTALGERSWELLDEGASDVFSWADPAGAARLIAGRLRRWQTIDELTASHLVRDTLVGASPAWRAVLRDTVEVARFTDAAVLVTGESGTGKERVAQLIHELDARPNKRRLVVLDCTTVVPQLSGSEFFGHEKGAFTGAAGGREGAFELADGGTLFLDEVGELPVTLQAELLRVVQEGTFKRVGSNVWRRSRFRLVCATNRDLAAEQEQGTFRHDFYYRIAGCRLHLPALRERPDDIVPLYRHFFRQVHPDREPPELDEAVRTLLVNRCYPGNVRDLRSLVLRIIHRHLGEGPVTVGDVPERDRPGAAAGAGTGAGGAGGPARGAPWRSAELDEGVRLGLGSGATLEQLTSGTEEVAVRLALARADGDVDRAARLLAIPPERLAAWLRTG